MYDIRQFKPTLYLLLILGLTGFAIAAEQPALWVLAGGAVVLNAWLVRTKRFTPMPRWLANGITLVSFVFVAMHVIGSTNTPILLIGQFLVLLHLIKLFEQRGNRDYAQLLVLSLLLMVAAAISTASLTFGALFIGYLFLSLYCCLLFHLKVEADKAKAAQPVPPEKFNATTLRQDQRYLPQSMRRLTGLVSAVSLGCAVFVFLFFPRTGAGMLGQLQLKPPEPLTGFNDQVQFNQVAKITQNNTPVGTVQVWRDGKPVSTGSLRLRGVTLSQYLRGMNGEWEWKNAGSFGTEKEAQAHNVYDTTTLSPRDPRRAEWRQIIHLDAIGSKALFSLGGVRTFEPARDLKVSYSHLDDILQRHDSLNLGVDYEVSSTGVPASPDDLADLPRQASTISPELAAFAKRAGGDAVRLRPSTLPAGTPSPADEEIAHNIEHELLTRFNYTLDLTDAADLFNGRDPLAVFVTETKRGHCEFFAGAMTVACQSLGLRARLVAGFVTDEFNSVGDGFFQIRQAHAHTWVEVLTPDHGWVTFDPTSGRELPPNESRSAWQRIKHVFDWMESKWAGSVIAYDTDRRENLIQKLNLTLDAGHGFDKLAHWRRQLRHVEAWWDKLDFFGREDVISVWVKLLAGVLTLFVLVVIAAIAWYLIDRRRIRKRALRIGLESLPPSERRRLARQLGFYEEMTELLERHKIARPPHLTPREFGRTLTFLPTEAYELVDRLTRIFYRVRYGGATVPPGQQHRLEGAVQKLAASLESPAASAAR